MFDEPLSPELVLVAPPELAECARLLLPESPFTFPTMSAAEIHVRFGLGFAAFVAVCIGATVGPLLFALLARAHS